MLMCIKTAQKYRTALHIQQEGLVPWLSKCEQVEENGEAYASWCHAATFFFTLTRKITTSMVAADLPVNSAPGHGIAIQS